MIHWAADKHLLLSSDYTVVAFIGLVRTATLRPQGPVVYTAIRRGNRTEICQIVNEFLMQRIVANPIVVIRPNNMTTVIRPVKATSLRIVIVGFVTRSHAALAERRIRECAR